MLAWTVTSVNHVLQQAKRMPHAFNVDHLDTRVSRGAARSRRLRCRPRRRGYRGNGREHRPGRTPPVRCPGRCRHTPSRCRGVVRAPPARWRGGPNWPQVERLSRASSARVAEIGKQRRKRRSVVDDDNVGVSDAFEPVDQPAQTIQPVEAVDEDGDFPEGQSPPQGRRRSCRGLCRGGIGRPATRRISNGAARFGPVFVLHSAGRLPPPTQPMQIGSHLAEYAGRDDQSRLRPIQRSQRKRIRRSMVARSGVPSLTMNASRSSSPHTSCLGSAIGLSPRRLQPGSVVTAQR